MIRSLVLLTLVMVFLLPVQPCLAAKPLTSDYGSLLVAEKGSEGISSAEAARIVQRKTGGKVLRVESQGAFYQVRVLLPNGVVKTFAVNRSTGAMG